MDLHLDPDEAALVRDMLERHLGDLRMEIGKTENFTMRNQLKENERLLSAVRDRLVAVHASS